MSNWTTNVLHHRLWQFLFSGFGSTLTFFLLGKNFMNMPLLKSVAFSGIITILIFAVLVGWYMIKDLVCRFWLHRSGNVWGMAIVSLKDAYADIHDLRKQDNVTDEQLLSVMTNLCDKLKEIFDNKTKADCSVSIKVPISKVDNPRDMEVRNLCRDSQHYGRDTERYQQAHHTVQGNTAYLEVVNKILDNETDLAYVNKNINNTPTYHNTSKDCYNNGLLDYNSELVYPILPIRRDGHDYRLFGFICADCKRPDAFEEKGLEVDMIQGVADGIYDIIEKRINQQQQ